MKSQVKSSNWSRIASNQPERNLPQSKNRSMSPESGTSGEITHDSDKLRGTKLDTDHIPSDGTMDAVDNLTKTLDKGVKIGEKRGIDQEKDRAKGQEEMKVGRSYDNIVSKKRQKNEGSGKNNLQPSKKIKIPNSPVYKGKISRSLVGSIYQVKLLILLLKNALDKNDDSFYLGTEVQKAKDFDDLVFQYKKNNKLVSCFLQAKHLVSSNRILFDDLVNNEKKHGAFYLKKYFDSYREIIKLKEGLHQPLTNPNREFVIYTNINFDQLGKDLEDSFQELKDKYSILNLAVKKGSKYLKFKDNFSQKAKLVSALKQKDNSVTDQEIEDFFKHLVFAVNQPNEEELEGIIERELGKQFNLRDASFVFSRLLNEGINIAKEEKSERTFLSNQCIKELFEKMKQQVATLVAIGPTKLSRIKMRGLGLIYNQEAIGELQNFLENKKCKILNLLAKNILLSAAKVNQVLDHNNYNNEDSCIFISLEDLLTLKYLVEAFKLQDKERLLVVMCEPIKDKDVGQLFNELNATIQSCRDKRAIFITEDNSLYRKIDDKFSYADKDSDKYRYKEITDKESNFKDLTPESQENLEERKVNFQGRTVNLGSLAPLEFLNTSISGKLLIDLAQGEEIEIGRGFPVPDQMDIERTFCFQVIKGNAFTDQDNSDIFAISNAQPKYLEKFSNDNKVKELNKDNPESHFKRICEENKKRNVHWLNREKDAKGKLVLVHKKSQGSLCNLHQYINLNIGKNENELIQRRLAIITGEPGIGKSATMERLCRRIKKKYSSLWVVKINLAGCRSKLPEVNFDRNNFIDFLLTSAQLSTELEKALFKCNLLGQESKIALLFDGFDEIDSAHRENILLLLKILKDLPSIDKLYISVRPYVEYRYSLEESLGILSCELSPLKPQDQKKFFQYLLKKEISESSNVDERRISTSVDKLLKSCSKITNEAFSLRNPLHLEILAKFFEEESREFCDNGNECNIKFDNFNFLDLYEYYIACKICIYIEGLGVKVGNKNFRTILDKKNLIFGKKSIDNSLESREKREDISLLTEYKKKFAALFLEELFDDENYLVQLGLGQEYRTDLREIGVLHSSIYEYHVARFFVNECLRDTNNRDPRIFKLLEEYYFHPDGKGMRYFFDLIVSRDYSLHVDAINGNFNEVKKLIESKDEDKRKKLLKVDGQGRSILHLIDDSTVKKFTYSVSGEIKNSKSSFYDGFLFPLIESKDKVFGYTPFEYALRSGNWRTANKFLELKGWFKKTGYVTSVERNMRLPTTSLDILQADSFIKSGLTLHKAIKEGYFYIGLWMIGNLKDAELEKEDSDGRKPLYYIMYKNKVPHSPFHMLKFISNRVDLNKPDRFGQTAAHFLVLMMDKEKTDEGIFLKDYSISLMSDIFGIMKENKVNMNVCDKSGNAPIYLVSDRLNIIRYLIEKADFSIDLNLPRKDGKTLVHLAAIRGDVEMIEYLASKDASLNKRDSDGNTPLHLAAIDGKDCDQSVALKMVRFLVESYADFNVGNNYGKAPLEVAAGDVRKYLKTLPKYREYLERNVLRVVKELQDLVACKGEELLKELLQLKEGIGNLLQLSNQQYESLKRLRLVPIYVSYILRKTDSPFITEGVNELGKILQDMVIERQLQELDTNVRKLLEKLEQCKQFFRQSLLNPERIDRVDRNIVQLSHLLKLIKAEEECQAYCKWELPSPNRSFHELETMQMTIQEVQSRQIKYLQLLKQGKVIEEDCNKDRKFCKKALTERQSMKNSHEWLLDCISNLIDQVEGYFCKERLLLIGSAQQRFKNIEKCFSFYKEITDFTIQRILSDTGVKNKYDSNYGSCVKSDLQFQLEAPGSDLGGLTILQQCPFPMPLHLQASQHCGTGHDVQYLHLKKRKSEDMQESSNKASAKRVRIGNVQDQSGPRSCLNNISHLTQGRDQKLGD